MSVKNRMIEEALERMEAEYETAAELQVAMEAQAFAFLAVRAQRGLPLTFPTTTGVPAPMTGGRISRP